MNCIGWIPHLTGDLFLTNRWLKILYGETDNHETFYFKLNSTNRPEGIPKDSPLDPERIAKGNHISDNSTILPIINSLDLYPYVAQCRPIDDTDFNKCSYFIYSFENNDLKTIKKIYVFERLTSSDLKNPILEYLASINIYFTKNSGFVTLSIDTSSKRIKSSNRDEAETQLLLETFQALRDILHNHTHHLNISTNTHDQVPDSIILPILSDGQLNSVTTNETLHRYNVCLAEHLECISNYAHQGEQDNKWNMFQLSINDKYKVMSSLMKTASGVINYNLQLLQEIRKLGYINPQEYNDLKDGILNMKSAYQSFLADVDTQFKISITNNSERQVKITLVLTLIIIILTAVLVFQG